MVSLSLDTPELAATYDVVGQRQFAHGKLLVSDLDIRRGQHVLDVGAGTGLLSAHVAEIVGPAGRVVAIDPLPLRVEIAARRARPWLEARVGRAEDLSAFADESFDAVYLNSVIHWIEDKAGVLAQIRRVLKRRGRVGFSTAAKEQPHSLEAVRRRALVAAGFAQHAAASVGIPYKVSSSEVVELFRQVGFRAHQVQIRSFVDYHESVQSVIDASRASSFGNHLSGLSADEQARVHAALGAELEQQRGPQGIRQERNLIFAVGEKIAADA
jgi:arsenite methyltransferase